MSNLYQPLSTLTIYQTENYYCGIKVFNKHPSHIKILSHNQFEKYLYLNSFYTSVEYFNSTKDL